MKKKTSTKKPVALKTMGVVGKIVAEKGEKWAKKCAGKNLSDPESVAHLVYNHFLESDLGKETWDSPGQNEGKVEYIFDSIHDVFIFDLKWMTEDEWQTISQDLYNMVYEGVF